MRRIEKGFTLIELMVVVAVIGVLAAIAIPQYQNYVKKSALGTAIASGSATKTIVDTDIYDTGSFPAGKVDATGPVKTYSAGVDPTPIEKDMPVFPSGIITLEPGATSNGVIKVALTKGSITGVEVRFIRDTNGVWTCEHNAQGFKLQACEYKS